MTERLHFHFHPLCTFLQHPLILVAFLHLFVRSYDQVSPVRQQTLSEEGPHLLLFTVVGTGYGGAAFSGGGLEL